MNSATDRGEQRAAILSRLADLGLSLAEDLHAQALSATDQKSKADLALAFHRISRSLRQTLALEARLERERKLAAKEAARDDARETLARVHKKRDQLRKAAISNVWSEYEPEDPDALLEELDAWVYEAAEDDAFLGEPIETLIARIKENLGLPANDAAPDDAPEADTRRSSA